MGHGLGWLFLGVLVAMVAPRLADAWGYDRAGAVALVVALFIGPALFALFG